MPPRAAGFSLLELTIVLTILAVATATMAVFLDGPIRSYFANRQRSDLASSADAAMRRLARDLRLALPNSIRLASVGAGQTYLEFLPVRTGGRYRDQASDGNQGDPLSFGGDSAFDTLGTLPASGRSAVVPGQDQLVVYNLGFAPADAYGGQNRSTIRSVSSGALAGESHLVFDSSALSLASPYSRFQIISGAASYVCQPGAVDAQGDASGTLSLWYGYPIQTAQPTILPGSGRTALLTRYVSRCSINYAPSPSLAQQRNGIVSVQLALTRANETVSLYQVIHVANLP